MADNGGTPRDASEDTKSMTEEEHFSVHNWDDYERVYDEDDMIEVRRGDLRALLDLATSSMDFGSGFWTEEDAEIARKAARRLGVDPVLVTPSNFVCKFEGKHNWQEVRHDRYQYAYNWRCVFCSATSVEKPAGA